PHVAGADDPDPDDIEPFRSCQRRPSSLSVSGPPLHGHDLSNLAVPNIHAGNPNLLPGIASETRRAPSAVAFPAHVCNACKETGGNARKLKQTIGRGMGMGDTIYLLQEDGRLVGMTEQPYDSEELLQRLLADYPDLLAGEQMSAAAPRRWLPIAREVAIPGEEGEAGRWFLDHLFIDQEGIPTLVEVKRSSDTRIRREVVGQLLEYAAHAATYLSAERLRGRFEAGLTEKGCDPDEVLQEFLGADADPQQFWQWVETHLRAGRMRLVFVADEIPPELRRVVEFLNRQMASTEVLAVEVKQYVGQGLTTLVPRVLGQGSCPVKCVNGGSLREEARLRAQASRTRAASVSDRVTASLAIDCMLRYRRCTRHSSSCSCRTAPISRRAAAALGKMPTTSTRRPISRIRRSSGFVEWIFCQ